MFSPDMKKPALGGLDDCGLVRVMVVAIASGENIGAAGDAPHRVQGAANFNAFRYT
ncbi:hypothetical protein D3C86_2100210 [compost metagenome]